MSATTAPVSRYLPQRRKWMGSLLHHVIVAGLGFVMIYPLLWMFASSFKAPSEIWTNITSLVPQHFTLDNYANGWKGFGGITFTTFYINSFIYAFFGTLAAVTTSAVVRFTATAVWVSLCASMPMINVMRVPLFGE